MKGHRRWELFVRPQLLDGLVRRHQHERGPEYGRGLGAFALTGAITGSSSLAFGILGAHLRLHSRGRELSASILTAALNFGLPVQT